MNGLLCSWSGGKDSCFALMKAVESGFIPHVLLNVLNEEGQISRSHGIPRHILQAQAKAIGLPLHLVESSWNEYEERFVNALQLLEKEYQLTSVVFGDIDLQAHRDWEEMVCERSGLKAILPLWQQNRKQLVLEMIASGIEATIVSCNETLGPDFLGRQITEELLEELESLGVDACGENGEYHTLVVNCPLFKERLKVEVSEKLHHGSYWFSRLILV